MSTQTATKPFGQRRRKDQQTREKTSVSIRVDVLEAARIRVKSGFAANLSAFVELAVEEKLRQTQRLELYVAYKGAAEDPLFMAGMNEISQSFYLTEADGI